jgi:hypothetical protein
MAYLANIKQELCETFCGVLSVREIPAGLAVGTGYIGMSGDAIGFYIVGPNADGKFSIEDNGLLIPAIESEGADLSNKTRREAFNTLLEEYSVQFDEESGELKTDPLSKADVPSASLRFIAFLLRVQDLILMSIERAASTFKEDATRLIKELAEDRVKIVENDYIVNEKLKELPADLGIVPRFGKPVALFFGVSETKIYEALLLQAYASRENIECSIVVMLESEAAITKKARQRANNHLDAVPLFREDERTACARVLKEAGLTIQ